MGDASEGSTSNHYTVLGRLAGGGMADIFLARATSEGGVERFVVLKRVISERSRDPQFAQMFLDEARLAAQLHHPNIAQVHDIGRIAGSYFFTMEYVHGEDVQTVLERLAGTRRMPVNLALYIATGALSALHHAHERRGPTGKPLGIVHRDVSPSNVMISFEGSIKLLDFGVAKAVQRTAESHTGTIKGKIAYMSPEQCQSETIDRRSDVFALGIVLYEMLTGARLFRRETDFNTMIAITTEEVPPPSEIRPDISPAVDAIVLKALSKTTTGRYASAAEMLEAIEETATREHLTLSATAMGRFLRDVFGDKPEPWLELSRETQKHVTLTGESQFDPHGGALGTSPGEILANERILEQLYRTPTLHGARSTADGSAPNIPSEARATLDLRSPSGLRTIPMPALDDDSELTAAPRGRRPVVLVAMTLLVVAAIVTAIVVVSNKRTTSTEPVAAIPDAAIVTPPPDAATEPAAVDAPAIALADCSAAVLSNADHTRCGIAACEQTDKRRAMTHYLAVAATARSEIATACRGRGIELATRPTQPRTKPPAKPPTKPPAPPPTTAKPDPCETNPLKCRE